jgi:hypothetical protein
MDEGLLGSGAEKPPQLVSSEARPAHVHYMSQEELCAADGNLADYRLSLLQRGKHLVVPLNAKSFGNRALQHVCSMTGELKQVSIRSFTHRHCSPLSLLYVAKPPINSGNRRQIYAISKCTSISLATTIR